MTATPPPADSPPSEGRRLRRDIGRIGPLFAGVGSIIGSGRLSGATMFPVTGGVDPVAYGRPSPR